MRICARLLALLFLTLFLQACSDGGKGKDLQLQDISPEVAEAEERVELTLNQACENCSVWLKQENTEEWLENQLSDSDELGNANKISFLAPELAEQYSVQVRHGNLRSNIVSLLVVEPEASHSPEPADQDSDGDGIANNSDNCPARPNHRQSDDDNDGIGNICDQEDNSDTDGDAIENANDNCMDEPNADQADQDEDGLGDACDRIDEVAEARERQRRAIEEREAAERRAAEEQERRAEEEQNNDERMSNVLQTLAELPLQIPRQVADFDFSLLQNCPEGQFRTADGTCGEGKKILDIEVTLKASDAEDGFIKKQTRDPRPTGFKVSFCPDGWVPVLGMHRHYNRETHATTYIRNENPEVCNYDVVTLPALANVSVNKELGANSQLYYPGHLRHFQLEITDVIESYRLDSIQIRVRLDDGEGYKVAYSEVIPHLPRPAPSLPLGPQPKITHSAPLIRDMKSTRNEAREREPCPEAGQFRDAQEHCIVGKRVRSMSISIRPNPQISTARIAPLEARDRSPGLSFSFCNSAQALMPNASRNPACFNDLVHINASSLRGDYATEIWSLNDTIFREKVVHYPYDLENFRISATDKVQAYLIYSLTITVQLEGEANSRTIYRSPVFNKYVTNSSNGGLSAFGSKNDWGMISNLEISDSSPGELKLVCNANTENLPQTSPQSLHENASSYGPHARRRNSYVDFTLKGYETEAYRSQSVKTYGGTIFGDAINVTPEVQPLAQRYSSQRLIDTRAHDFAKCRLEFAPTGSNDQIGVHSAGIVLYRPWLNDGADVPECYSQRITPKAYLPHYECSRATSSTACAFYPNRNDQPENIYNGNDNEPFFRLAKRSEESCRPLLLEGNTPKYIRVQQRKEICYVDRDDCGSFCDSVGEEIQSFSELEVNNVLDYFFFNSSEDNACHEAEILSSELRVRGALNNPADELCNPQRRGLDPDSHPDYVRTQVMVMVQGMSQCENY